MKSLRMTKARRERLRNLKRSRLAATLLCVGRSLVGFRRRLALRRPGARRRRRHGVARGAVEVRVCRLAILRRRVLTERRHYDFDSFFELRIVPGTPRLRVEINVEVGRDTAILDFPLALQVIERYARRGHL